MCKGPEGGGSRDYLRNQKVPTVSRGQKKRDKEIQDEAGKIGKGQTMQHTDKHIELVFILRELRGI